MEKGITISLEAIEPFYTEYKTIEQKYEMIITLVKEYLEKNYGYKCCDFNYSINENEKSIFIYNIVEYDLQKYEPIRVNHDITFEDIKRTLKVLADNGVERDECEVVLQAIGYTLLDTELDCDKIAKKMVVEKGV